MAATNTTIDLNTGDWQQLTTADVSAARVQNVGAYELFIQATAGTTPPTSSTGALTYLPGQGFDASSTLANLFPGVTGANRLWAKCTAQPLSGRASVSHA